jgi:DTW domain-containing protein
LCGAIPRVDNRIEVAVLQHPRERTHPFGTAKLAELGLRRVEVIVDHVGRVRKNPELLGALQHTALLYPGPAARDVTTLEPHERPARLLVIDGTWHHARTLYRDVPGLRALPHLTLPSHARSAFAIRRQPREYCLSTIEAIVLALEALEPDTRGFEELIGAFMTMQNQQLARAGSVGRVRKPARARQSRAIPRALIEEYGSLVVVYAESISDAETEAHRSLMCCTAERVATGEQFHRVLRREAVSDAHLEHVGLRREDVAAGCTEEEFGREWSAFVRPEDHLAAWNQGTLGLLGRLTAHSVRSSVSLKGAYHNHQRSRGPCRPAEGALEQIVAAEGLAARERAVRLGPLRSRQRLDCALRLADFLHRCANRAT